ncbi:hypothetical protein Mapa_013350 [Marchantia paleacea]|nr:hypothetical protein Mapa_013350 [Marchantia paleacea]
MPKQLSVIDNLGRHNFRVESVYLLCLYMSKGLRNPPTSPTKSTFSVAVAMPPHSPCQLSLRLFFKAPMIYTIGLHQPQNVYISSSSAFLRPQQKK